jgi:hypothetical protein
MHPLSENNGSHVISIIAVRHKFSMIFSNAKDEAWSQYEHLRDMGNLKNTTGK